MKSRMVTMPLLGMIAGTRVAAGAGLGLLLAGWLEPEQRRAVGWTLFAVGAISTIPLAAEVIFRDERPERTRRDDGSSSREHELASS